MNVTDLKAEQSNSFLLLAGQQFCACLHVHLCTFKEVCEGGKTVCLLTWGLPWGHGRLPHARRTLWEAWGGNARLAWHHALLLESCPPLFLQFLLNLVDFLCQQVVILRLEGMQDNRGRILLHTSQQCRNKYFHFLIPQHTIIP